MAGFYPIPPVLEPKLRYQVTDSLKATGIESDWVGGSGAVPTVFLKEDGMMLVSNYKKGLPLAQATPSPVHRSALHHALASSLLPPLPQPLEALHPDPLPPWTPAPRLRIDVAESKAEAVELHGRMLAATGENDRVVYTDGSKLEGGWISAGVAVRLSEEEGEVLWAEKSVSMGQVQGVYTAELLAIQLALTLLPALFPNPKLPATLLIFADNTSALRGPSDPRPTSSQHLCLSTGPILNETKRMHPFVTSDLPLPSKDYYGDKGIVKVYREVAKKIIAELYKSTRDHVNSADLAAGVVELEKKIARVSLDAEDLNLPFETYNPKNTSELQALFPSISFANYFSSYTPRPRYPDPTALKFGELLGTKQPILQQVDCLSNFLLGVAPDERKDERKPRDEICLQSALDNYGFLVGRYYAQRAFPGESKAYAEEIIHAIIDTFGSRLPSRSWLDAETRKKAQEKVDTIQVKVAQSRAYLEDVLACLGQSGCRTAPTPMIPNQQLRPAPADHTPSADLRRRDLQAVGLLVYAMLGTRPDLAHVVGVLGRFVARPDNSHWAAVVRVCQHLKGTLDHGIEYAPDDAPLEGFEAYSDSDWGADPTTSRSTMGYAFVLASGAVAWSSKLQPREAVFLGQLLRELGLPTPSPVRLLGNNQGANALSRDPQFYDRTRHLRLTEHFVREMVQQGVVKVTFIPTARMTADAMTKSLPLLAFSRHRDALGDQYHNYTIVRPDGKEYPVNSRLTGGEDGEDAGGIAQLFTAWKQRLID
ncbi:hypothetical protein JCM10207_003694 [Rhodosporidiobolus poonsookiae]